MIHKLLFTDPAQTVLPSGFGIASFGFLVFTQSGGSILIHFLLSLGGAIAIATIVRLYRLHILDRILPLAVEEETIFKAIEPVMRKAASATKPVRKRKPVVK